MFIRLALVLIVVPLVELVLLLTLADMMGFAATIGMVVLTGVTGGWLLRRQGLRALGTIGSQLRLGRLPSDELLDALLLVVAGVLLLTPGILTDLLGIGLLIPVTRRLFRRGLIGYFQRKWRLVRFPSESADSADFEPPATRVIDSYVVPRRDDSPP